MPGSWLLGGAEFKSPKVVGNEGVHVSTESIDLHNWCLQTKLKGFLEMFLLKLVLMLTGTAVALRPSMAPKNELGLQ